MNSGAGRAYLAGASKGFVSENKKAPGVPVLL
jgi:hypothetical protein